MRHPGGRDTVPAARILRRGARSGRLMHVEEIAARPGEGVPWPEWVPGEITLAFSRAGVTRPWAHQAAMAEHLEDVQLMALRWIKERAVDLAPELEQNPLHGRLRVAERVPGNGL